MDGNEAKRRQRRDLLGASFAVPVLMAAGVPLRARAAPTPACGDDGKPTPRQMEGPFYTPDTPRRTSLLEPGLRGTRLLLTGRVLSTDCTPLAGALLDFWQCDASGAYDNAGFVLRGHQYADADGRFALETIVPGNYPGRVRHIHVKVQARNGPLLTTQIYFPDEPGNARDFLFRPELLMKLADAGNGKAGRFDFVLRAA
jgi:protocatechuate 3,4-dioxygenase beta subunit